MDTALIIETFGVNLLAGGLIAAFCGMVSPLILFRQLSYMADTLGHSMLLGIGAGVVLGMAPVVVLIPFSIVFALVLNWIARSHHVDLVSSCAAMFSVCFGVGVLLLTTEQKGPHEILHIMFGNLLWLDWSDILFLMVCSMPILTLIMLRKRQLVLMSLNEHMAQAQGVQVVRLDYLFMVCVALLIAASVKLVGVILITGLISLPAMTAAKLSASLRGQFLISPIVSLTSALGGLLASLYFDLPPGPCIITTAGVLFLLGWTWERSVR